MSVLFIILAVVFILCCLSMIAIILLQKERNAGGMGSVAGMGNVADTYWDKNKGRSAEGSLKRWTKIVAVLLAIMSVVLCLI